MRTPRHWVIACPVLLVLCNLVPSVIAGADHPKSKIENPKSCVELLDSRVLTGRVVLAPGADALAVCTGTDTQTVKVAEVLSVEFQPEGPYRPPDPGVVLRDGTRLAGRIGVTKGDTVAVRTDLVGDVALSLERVAALVFNTPPADRAPDARPAGEVAAPGVLLANRSFVPGPLRWVNATALAVDSPVLGLVEVPRERVLTCLVGAKTPSAASGAEVRFANGDFLTARIAGVTARELALEAPWLGARTVPLTEVQRVRFLGGRVRPLTDLRPTQTKTVPFFDAIRPPRRDLSLEGGPLRIGRRTYVAGWGVEARTELTYALDGRYAFFRSDVGIDHEVGLAGSVEFLVELDGRAAWRSGEMTGAMEAKRVHLKVAGAKVLRLIVDFGSNANVLAHADWGEPVLVLP